MREHRHIIGERKNTVVDDFIGALFPPAKVQYEPSKKRTTRLSICWWLNVTRNNVAEMIVPRERDEGRTEVGTKPPAVPGTQVSLVPWRRIEVPNTY